MLRGSKNFSFLLDVMPSNILFIYIIFSPCVIIIFRETYVKSFHRKNMTCLQTNPKRKIRTKSQAQKMRYLRLSFHVISFWPLLWHCTFSSARSPIQTSTVRITNFQMYEKCIKNIYNNHDWNVCHWNIFSKDVCFKWEHSIGWITRRIEKSIWRL